MKQSISKSIALALVTVSLLSLAACGTQKTFAGSAGNKMKEDKVTTISEDGSGVGKGFNDSITKTKGDDIFIPSIAE